VLKTSEPAVLAHRSDWEGGSVLAVHNLGDEPCIVEIEDACDVDATLVDLLETGPGASLAVGRPFELQLAAYGYRWLRVHTSSGR
jgi:hypothetical protein